MRHRLWCGLLLGLALLTAGCNHARYRQMESVASDWCMTIRASQVIPVYPPREDLEPGDVFLVTQPLPQQAREYKTKGYLPLDQSYQRLNPYLIRLHYSMGYVPTFLAHPFANVPHPVPRRGGAEAIPAVKPASTATQPADSGGSGAIPPDTLSARADALAEGFANATLPLAFFPAYSFSVDAGGKLDLAVPISGLPVALGLLAGSKASGQVIIKDAFTYGLQLQSMDDILRNWASRRDVQASLRYLVQAHLPTPIYLRVVNRVYLTGAVDVGIQSDGSFGGALAAGKTQDADASAAPQAAGSTGDGQFTALTDKVNAALAKSAAMPRGAVAFQLATSRSVALRETFERPLVIGYIAFDVPVLSDGRIGPPSLTREALANGIAKPVDAQEAVPPAQRNYTACRDRYMKLTTDTRAQFISRMAEHLPEALFGQFSPAQYEQARAQGHLNAFIDRYVSVETDFFLNDPDNTNMAILDAACRYTMSTATTR
ncbi:hypothetical protein [Nitratidesulfovibrio sp.]|uniref:hypothetical protein n=1 Tax=Nitratidesulfovibrio sp. TaxID=2802297 RepID=UPI00334119FC